MKTLYTNFTPIAPQVPRQLAIEILQSHSEVITLNPLVLEHHPIKAPRDAPEDEYYSTWYEITERIQFMPGIGKIGSGKITFRGVFHDMPWGIQTHMYIPLGVDLKNKWQIRGSQPGEPPEPRELGSKAPTSGLYLREDCEITCNPLALSFVKKEMKAASKIMVARMLKKAELLDAGVLQAMFENGRLKTWNPNDRSNVPQIPQSPSTPDTRWRASSISTVSTDYRNSSYGQTLYPGAVPTPSGSGVAIEMEGDYPPQPSASPRPGYSPQTDIPTNTSMSTNPRWSASSNSATNHSSVESRPSSYYNSPHMEQKHYSAELPNTRHHGSPMPSPMFQPPASPNPPQQHFKYNPQDYVRYA